MIELDGLAPGNEIISEDNGTFYLRITQPQKISISNNFAVELEPRENPFWLCTSLGYKSNVLSLNKIDTVVAIARTERLAEAANKLVGRIIKEAHDIEHSLKIAKKTRKLGGVLILKDDQVGVLGKIKFVPISLSA
ncbi:MAG: hypothetical protein ABIH50_07775 [bacterium]